MVSSQLPSLPFQGVDIRDRNGIQHGTVKSTVDISENGNVNTAVSLDGESVVVNGLLPASSLIVSLRSTRTHTLKPKLPRQRPSPFSGSNARFHE